MISMAAAALRSYLGDRGLDLDLDLDLECEAERNFGGCFLFRSMSSLANSSSGSTTFLDGGSTTFLDGGSTTFLGGGSTTFLGGGSTTFLASGMTTFLHTHTRNYLSIDKRPSEYKLLQHISATKKTEGYGCNFQ